MTTKIKRVHVIFKTHLDLGFTDMAENVIGRYLGEFIPQALDLSEQLSKEEGPANFVWTTGSWLIHEFLQTASPEGRNRMENALHAGRIVWHGLPFTTHSELMDEKLFEFGMSLSRNLDQRFGRTTIATKMTDVPGHTIGIVPIMARNGIKYLHLGANPVCTRPSVPPVFVWRASDGSEVVVNYADDYGKALEIDGFEDVLYFAHTGDNHGPSPIEDVRALFIKLEKQYPDAEIVASTLDAFAEKLLEIKSRLPVICEEIGDSWIHGASSDPWKIARYRELLRLRDKWTASGELDEQSEQYAQFCNRLMLIPEHTWGMNEHVYLFDYDNYSAEDFSAARKRDLVAEQTSEKYKYMSWPVKPNRTYSRFESSWHEQRAYLDEALSALDDKLVAEAREAFEALVPKEDQANNGNSRRLETNVSYNLGQFLVRFAGDGSITQLVDGNGKPWADDNHGIGSYRYETFAKENYDRFFDEYVINLKQHHNWADNDLGKPGMEYTEPKPRHKQYIPTARSIELQSKSDIDQVKVELTISSEASKLYGAPSKLTVVYTFYKEYPRIDVEVDAMNKQACRLPEASWFSFVPLVDSPNQWKMDKLGEWISPLLVVKNGNRNMHAIGSRLRYQGPDGEACIETLDAPVVCPGEPRLLQFDNTFRSLADGFHFNLHNNVWGTNFMMWFEDDMKYRFRLTLKSHPVG